MSQYRETAAPPASDRERARALGRRLEKLRFWRHAMLEGSDATAAYNRSEGDNPLFFFHGDFDAGGAYVRRIANLSRQPIVAISPLGLHGDAPPATIEAMAAIQVGEVLAARPEGALRVGGYCNGALVAYEVARALRAAGRDVEVVVLFEPPSLNVRPAYRRVHGMLARVAGLEGKGAVFVGAAMWGVWSLGRALGTSPPELYRTLREKIATKRTPATESAEEAAGERGMRESHARVLRAYYRASATHVPAMADFPVVALSTGKDAGGRPSALYDGVAWQSVCRDFTHHRLPGYHLNEGADTVAGYFSDILSGGILSSGMAAGDGQRAARR